MRPSIPRHDRRPHRTKLTCGTLAFEHRVRGIKGEGKLSGPLCFVGLSEHDKTATAPMCVLALGSWLRHVCLETVQGICPPPPPSPLKTHPEHDFSETPRKEEIYRGGLWESAGRGSGRLNSFDSVPFSF